MRARRDLGGDFGQVQVHGFVVTPGQDEGCALAVLGADCAEDIIPILFERDFIALDPAATARARIRASAMRR